MARKMNSLVIPLLFVLLCSAVFPEASCSPEFGEPKLRERRYIAEGYNRTTHYVTQDIVNLGSAIGTFTYNTFCFSVSWIPWIGCTYPPKTGGDGGTTDPGTTEPPATPEPDDPADDYCCLCLE